MAEELDPYLQYAFYPLRPKVMYGKSAALEGATTDPKKRWNGREVVGTAYNTGVILFNAQDCFPDDHRVIVAEQDLRFNKEDCRAFEYLKEIGVDTVLQGQGIRESIKVQGSSQPPGKHLEDVLACITAAHRWTTEKCPDGHAQWVWLSSEPYFKGAAPHYHWNEGFNDGRSSVPGTGNYLHTFTSKLARWLKVNVLVPRLTKFVFVCRISDCGRWWELAAPGHPTTNLKSSLNVFLLLGLGEVLSPFFLAGSLQPLPLQLLCNSS